MKKVTMSDVAVHANVSKSTVSQYINGRYEYMGEKTRKKIENSINQLGYQVNTVARSLRQKRTFTIGVVVANILHSFSTQVIRAIEDVCNDNEINVIICNADDNPGKEKKYINTLRAKQVDGLITFPTGRNVELYYQMIQENYPLVFVDRIIKELPVNCFLLDNEYATKIAVDSLVNFGHQKIGMVTTSLSKNVTPRIERINGLKQSLIMRGITPVNDYIKGFEENEMQEGISKIFSLDNPPTALIAGNDLTLIKILNHVKEKAMKIPKDIALIGIDDVAFAQIYNPPLATIVQPAFKIGEEAAKFLIDKIENPSSSKKENKIFRFKPHLVRRKSI